MSKTPAAILNELAMRNNSSPPTYVALDEQNVGTHEPTFRYHVSAFSYNAFGYGRSKKNAKHEAAKSLLEILKQEGIYTAEASMPSSPWKSATEIPEAPIDVKAIADLQDLCFQQNLPDPEFTLIGQNGPPHCPQFTYQCKIGSILDFSVSSTKKKAKHSVAIKLLSRLKEALPEELDTDEMTNTSETNILVNTNVNEHHFVPNSIIYKRKINLGLKVSSYMHTLTDRMKEKNINYEDLWKERNITDLTELKKVLNSLDLDINVDITEECEQFLGFLSISSEPPFYFCDYGSSEAVIEQNLVEKALDFLKTMTKE